MTLDSRKKFKPFNNRSTSKLKRLQQIANSPGKADNAGRRNVLGRPVQTLQFWHQCLLETETWCVTELKQGGDCKAHGNIDEAMKAPGHYRITWRAATKALVRKHFSPHLLRKWYPWIIVICVWFAGLLLNLEMSSLSMYSIFDEYETNPLSIPMIDVPHRQTRSPKN